jgi:hypothetical protein
MFALTLALTLGIDPMEMAKPRAQVVDRADLVRPGMTQQKVGELLGEEGAFVCGGSITGYVTFTFDYPRSRVSVTFSNDGVGGTDCRVTRVRKR